MNADLPTPRFLEPAPRCLWDAGAELGEGTLWSPREEALYWVDILGQRLHRLHPESGARQSWPFDEEISAVAERRDGPGLLVSLRHGIALFDPARDAPPQPLQRLAAEPASNRLNDGKCDAQGRYWGGSMDFACEAPSGVLYRFDPDGHHSAHEQGFAVFNGPTWSADGRTFYFNDTVRRRVYACDFDPDAGTLSNKREWLRLAKEDGHPDGMCTDAAGRLWICHWGGACVSCHDPVSARELCRVELPTAHITDCAFGGPGLRTLYITSAWSGLDAAQRAAQPLAGALFAIAVDSPGVPAARFGG